MNTKMTGFKWLNVALTLEGLRMIFIPDAAIKNSWYCQHCMEHWFPLSIARLWLVILTHVDQDMWWLKVSIAFCKDQSVHRGGGGDYSHTMAKLELSFSDVGDDFHT